MNKISLCGYYGFDDFSNSERSKNFKLQREKQGFDDSELWSLGDTIINFSIPRLESYLERLNEGKNADNEKERTGLKRLIKGLKIFVRDNGARIFNTEEKKITEEALKDFGVILPSLWY